PSARPSGRKAISHGTSSPVATVLTRGGLAAAVAGSAATSSAPAIAMRCRRRSASRGEGRPDGVDRVLGEHDLGLGGAEDGLAPRAKIRRVAAQAVDLL